MNWTREGLAGKIDHTLLKPQATDEEVRRLCREALEWGCASACVNPARLPAALEVLRGTPVKACAVAAFPLGASDPEVRVFETRKAAEMGAGEIDTVIDLGLVKAGEWERAEAEVKAQVEAASGVPLKVILETGLLSREEILRLVEICARAGAAFVKTSTGFGPRGASVEDVRLMKEAAGGRIQVKASGGIRTLEQALALLEAGADRLGMSGTKAVLSALAGG